MTLKSLSKSVIHSIGLLSILLCTTSIQTAAKSQQDDMAYAFAFEDPTPIKPESPALACCAPESMFVSREKPMRGYPPKPIKKQAQNRVPAAPMRESLPKGPQKKVKPLRSILKKSAVNEQGTKSGIKKQVTFKDLPPLEDLDAQITKRTYDADDAKRSAPQESQQNPETVLHTWDAGSSQPHPLPAPSKKEQNQQPKKKKALRVGVTAAVAVGSLAGAALLFCNKKPGKAVATLAAGVIGLFAFKKWKK
jgi:hypothetical protein